MVTHDGASQESALRTPSSSPTLYLLTACGDPYKPRCPIQISNHRSGTAEFDAVNRLLGVNEHSFGLYTTLRPQCSFSYEYDESLVHLRAISESVRCATIFNRPLTTFAYSRSRPRSNQLARRGLYHENPSLRSQLRGFVVLSEASGSRRYP